MKRSQLNSVSVLNRADSFAGDSLQQQHFYVFSVLVWCACVIPSSILFLTSTRVWQETIVYTSGTQLLRNSLIFLVVIYSLYLVLRHGKHLFQRPFGYILITSSVIFYPSFSGLVHGDNVSRELVAAFITLIVALALFSIKISVHNLKIFALLGGITGLLSLAMAWLRPSGAYVILEGSRVLAGPFENSNYLGIVLVLSFPFIFLIRFSPLRYSAAILIILPILMGGSETALSTVLVLAIVWTVGSCFRTSNGKNLFFSLAVIVSFFFSLLLPFLLNDPEALSRRGALWQVARSNLTDVLAFGGGLEWFNENSQLTGFPMDHAHNLFLEPLFIGGITFLILKLVLLWKIYLLGSVHVRKRNASIVLFLQGLILAGATGDFFIMDARDLRFFVSGFIIIASISIATNLNPVRKFV